MTIILLILFSAFVNAHWTNMNDYIDVNINKVDVI